jgi:hypothetical protein
MPPTRSDQDTIDWPLWHFAQLEAAVERGDFARAAQALRELERLGVSVVFRGRQTVRVPAEAER